MKKGQVTLFIIIGIVIVIVAFLLMPHFLSMLNVQGSGSDSSPESYITSCLTQELGSGLFMLGAQGGYFAPYSTLSIAGYNFTALTSSDVPSVNEIESQLSSYLDVTAKNCISDTGEFHGMTITAAGTVQANVSVYENDIIAMIHMPVSISTQDSQRTVSEFTAKIDAIRLPEMLRYMNQTTLTMEQGLGTDARLVDRNDLQVYYIPTENGTVVDIIDPNSLVNSEPFEISYAVQG